MLELVAFLSFFFFFEGGGGGIYDILLRELSQLDEN